MSDLETRIAALEAQVSKVRDEIEILQNEQRYRVPAGYCEVIWIEKINPDETAAAIYRNPPPIVSQNRTSVD